MTTNSKKPEGHSVQKIAVAVDDFADFYELELARFEKMGGDPAYLQFVVAKVLGQANDTQQDDQRYGKATVAIRKTLTSIQSSSVRLLNSLEHVNEKLSIGEVFEPHLIDAVTEIRTIAGEINKKLRLKKTKGGQARQLRRHYFRSALEPYMRWKNVGFRKRSNLDAWWNGWALWLRILNVREPSAILRSKRKGGLGPKDVSDLLLSVSTRAQGDATPLTRSWWQRKPRVAAVLNAVLDGADTYLWWKRGLYRCDGNQRVKKRDRPLSVAEREYAKVALRFVRGRGVTTKRVKLDGRWSLIGKLL